MLRSIRRGRHRHAATVAARNFLPHARVLAASLARQHPGRRLTVLLADGDETDRARREPFDILLPADVGIADAELHHRAMLFDLQGLVGSLRPHLIAHLIATRGGSVVLLDADMEVFAPVEDLWRRAERHGVVLSPHTIDPLPGRPGDWPEELLLRAGTFNAGLLGVGPQAGAFLRWHAERCDRDCVLDPARGLQYSQTWLNLVPALFEHTVLRDRGLNAMVHNLRGRDIEWRRDRPYVAGVPLRLFHHTGYDPTHPEQLSRYFPGDPFAQVAGRPGLRRMARAYGDRLRANGWPAHAPARWTTLADGTPVDAASSTIHNQAILRGDAVPDPFAADHAFAAWLHADDGTGLSRYLRGLHLVRADLRARFPDVPGDDTAAYLAWAAEPGTVGPPFAPAGRARQVTAA